MSNECPNVTYKRIDGPHSIRQPPPLPIYVDEDFAAENANRYNNGKYHFCESCGGWHVEELKDSISALREYLNEKESATA